MPDSAPASAVPPAPPSVDPTASVTERGWDGWPTEPTPEYLIPRMGKVPVSSTVHFQTVVMTRMADTLEPQSLWSRLRMPLTQAARERAEREVVPLVITRAAYGELDTDGVVDVTEVLQQAVRHGRLAFRVDNTLVPHDPAPGIRKSLAIEYELGGAAAALTMVEGGQVDIGIGMRHVSASALFERCLQPPPASVADIASRLIHDGYASTDLDPDAIDESMTDVLDRLLGFAPRRSLDPLALAPDDDPDGLGDAGEPAEGVILYHEQGWYGRGLALGNLLHSVALAPGEVTQVAMTHWNHVTNASGSEQVAQADTSAEADTQDRSVTEVQDSALREHTCGSSAADSASDSSAWGISSIEAKASLGWGSVKGSIAGTSQSNGSSHTVSSVVTRSDGDRDLAMEANQRVSATTRRQAEAARTRRATVVREVSQSEDEQLTTRVVANYNHMHALTIMYFEVIEVFSMRTRVVDAERLVFLPYRLHPVPALIPRYRSVLVDAARAAGRPDLAEAIRHYQQLGVLEQRIAAIQEQSDAAGTRLGEITTRLGALHQVFGRPPLEAQLAELNHQRIELSKGLLAMKDLPAATAPLAAAPIEAQLKALDTAARPLQAALDALDLAEGRARSQLEAERAALQRSQAALQGPLLALREARRVLQALGETEAAALLHDNRLFFNQAVWLSLSPSAVLALARRRKTFQGEMLCETIDPAPVAISGRHVAYRWRIADAQKSQAFKQVHVNPYVDDPNQQLSTVQADVAVPTGGVFGEAVLGCGVSAEKIDLSRFWNWKDSMIPILPTSINPLSAATPTAQALSAEPGRLDESSARLGPLQDLPAPSGFSALAQTMQAQIFRDMSGQGMLQSLAEATTKAAASSEQGAAQLASQNLKAGLDFMSDMAAKALSVAAAPETGGGSLLGGMVASKGGGGASLLGGVLNAKGADGKGDLLDKLTGGKAGLVDGVERAVDGGTKGGKAAAGGGGGGGNGTGTGSGGSGGGGGGGGGAPPNPHIPEQELEEVQPPPPPAAP